MNSLNVPTNIYSRRSVQERNAHLTISPKIALLPFGIQVTEVKSTQYYLDILCTRVYNNQPTLRWASSLFSLVKVRHLHSCVLGPLQRGANTALTAIRMCVFQGRSEIYIYVYIYHPTRSEREMMAEGSKCLPLTLVLKDAQLQRARICLPQETGSTA